MNLFFSLMERLFPFQARHRELLRSTCDSVGREVEGWDYDQFTQATEEIVLTHTIDGVDVTFTIEVVDRNSKGVLQICIDARSPVNIFPFPLPSYVFWKYPDGSIKYHR